MNNIYVTGYNGRLGKYLVERYKYKPFNVDITDKAAVKRFYSLNPVDVVINCAAVTNVDLCETYRLMAFRTNALGVLNLLDDSYHGRLIQISTDFIFNGRSGPYSEMDVNDIGAVNIYGHSKYLGELVCQGDERAMVVRTTVLYGGHYSGKLNLDFVSWLVGRLEKGEVTSLSPDYYTTPTYVPHLAEGIDNLTKNPNYGIINIVGKDYVSRYWFGVKIARIFGYDERLIVPETTKWEVAERPKLAGLSVDLAEAYNIPIYRLEEGLDDYRSNWERKTR